MEPFTYSHKVYEEYFYKTKIRTRRLSGVYDTIPLVVSERIIDVKKNWTGTPLRLIGAFHSFNRRKPQGGSHLELFAFATEISLEYETDDDWLEVTGYVVKEPVYRETPLHREITDLLIAVNRRYAKTDYIPCIVWGRNARYAADFQIGEKIWLKGRVQSREYNKWNPETESLETKTAYEVSVQRISRV